MTMMVDFYINFTERLKEWVNNNGTTLYRTLWFC